MRFRLFCYKKLNCNIMIHFKGLRNNIQGQPAPKLTQIDYYEFLNLKLKLPNREQDSRRGEIETRNMSIAKVHNLNFRHILGKKGVMEHSFKQQLAQERKQVLE